MNLLTEYIRLRKALAEEVYPISAYDDIFPYHPDYVHRYLPAAFLQVRSDENMKILEFNDREAFRREVAHAAFMMHKLSNSDLGYAAGPQPQQESLNESFASGKIRHVRAFHMGKDEYLAVLDEKTFMNVTLDEMFRQMATKMDPLQARKIVAKLKEVGEVVWDDPIMLSTEIDR